MHLYKEQFKSARWRKHKLSSKHHRNPVTVKTHNISFKWKARCFNQTEKKVHNPLKEQLKKMYQRLITTFGRIKKSKMMDYEFFLLFCRCGTYIQCYMFSIYIKSG